MEYQIDFGIWGSIFPVPTAVADRHLKFCSEQQLKVLLLALRDAPHPVDVQYIAKRLGLSPSQISDCLDYWQQAGLFSTSASSQDTPSPAVRQPAPSSPSSATISETVSNGEQKITTVRVRSKMTPSQISEMCKNDSSIPWLLEELQQRLARPLSPAETETVAYLYSYFHLTPDYILMAVEYCKCIGKTSMRYIERLITGWVDQGIDTHDKAEAHILELSHRASNEGLIKSLFGIQDRELSKKEKDFIQCWFQDYGFDAELIKLAYDRTVDNTGKISFPYLNKILTQWHQQGIRTREQALAEMGSRTSPVSPGDDVPSYDLDAIEKIMELNSNQ